MQCSAFTLIVDRRQVCTEGGKGIKERDSNHGHFLFRPFLERSPAMMLSSLIRGMNYPV